MSSYCQPKQHTLAAILHSLQKYVMLEGVLHTYLQLLLQGLHLGLGRLSVSRSYGCFLFGVSLVGHGLLQLLLQGLASSCGERIRRMT